MDFLRAPGLPWIFFGGPQRQGKHAGSFSAEHAYEPFLAWEFPPKRRGGFQNSGRWGFGSKSKPDTATSVSKYKMF